MREGQFINQNKERWDTYLEDPTDDPDELAKRFTQLVDDLAYAKTFYTGSQTTKYVNGMAAEIYLDIYKNKKQETNRFYAFWSMELPLIFYKYRIYLLLTFVLFVLFFFLGLMASALEPQFIQSVLGDSYVEMTEQNIADGDPFGVYKKSDSFTMFMMIAWNNIRVSLMIFGSGIFLGIGTLFILFQNSLMVGVFDYLFYRHHLGTEFFLVVFIHGILELSAIVVASSAGFVLGVSVLFPKTYTRLHSLRFAAKDSVKMIIGLFPIFIVAAFFEAYVTRYTGMPLFLSLTILIGSLSFVLFYFVYWPIRVFRKSQHNSNEY